MQYTPLLQNKQRKITRFHQKGTKKKTQKYLNRKFSEEK